MTRASPGQIPLTFPDNPDFSSKAFRSGESTAEAEAALAAYPNWPRRCLVLTGPPQSGKTHLGHIWAKAHNAVIIQGASSITDFHGWRGRALWIDDAQLAPEQVLFTAINMAMLDDVAGVLLTSRVAPATWPVDLPDLRSRLGAATLARLYAPDDKLFADILEKLFLDRGIKPGAGLIDYLSVRIERSVPAARQVVIDLDRAAAAAKSNLTRRFAAQHFDKGAGQGLLF